MELNFVLGTAAELIKMYPVIHYGAQRGHAIRVVATGQSRENFLMQYADLNLRPEDLVFLLPSTGDLSKSGAALRWFLRTCLISRSRFRKSLLLGNKSFVLVHGDTLSTLAGSWLATKTGVPVVHVEAGLRSTHLLQPFPEEITRRLVSRWARYHMAPDSFAKGNLEKAGVKGTILNTGGNTLLDAVRLAGKDETASGGFGLVNIHRFENLHSDARWKIAVDTVVRAAGYCKIVFVTHPPTRHKLDSDRESERRMYEAGVEIRDRMPFTEFISLLKSADFLISDGGSNQEECSYLGKPCLLLREATERKEGLDTCCVLSKFDQAAISNFLSSPKQFKTPALDSANSPSQSIISALEMAI